MTDKLEQYQRADTSLSATNRLWPLYGAGFENFGVDGKPIEVPMPAYGPDELLIRHDACGHCFSDIKVIRAGQDHPRIHRTMREKPVVLGHEVSITVVGVGAALRDQYKVGDRFIIQADIFYHGENCSYGYEIDGGLSEYTVIDQRVLNGDHGNYLIPIQKADTGYAEAALTEPWACVIAAYQLRYRTAPRNGGTMWIIGTERAKAMYTFSRGFDEAAHPAKLLLTNVPAPFAAWLKARAAQLGIEVVDVPELPDPATVETDDAPVSPAADSGDTGRGVEDIILLGADADLIERASPNLASYGIMVLMDDAALARKVKMDVGRIHYNRWLYVGSDGTDIATAYSDTPARSTLKPGGAAWFVGAGGPMGRMHVQAAIQSENGPATVVCTDISDERLDDLCTSFSMEAQSKGRRVHLPQPDEQGSVRRRDGAVQTRRFRRQRLRRRDRARAGHARHRRRGDLPGSQRRDEHLRGRAARQVRRDRPERRLSQAGARHRALGLDHREHALHAGSGGNRATVAQPLRRCHRLAGGVLRRPQSRGRDALPR